MKYLTRLIPFLGVLLVSCTSQPPSEPVASPVSPSTTLDVPNVSFTVEAEGGNCPEAIGLWELMLGFEGGADHTVIADFSPIAKLPVKIVQSQDRLVMYQAPLQEEYSSCTGIAQSEALTMYAFRFREGNLQFTVDLTQGQGYRNIRYADISANRPYVHWRAAN
ncbi:hypothetical protein PN462_09520 [Spirulina sp. CS-785/01]|uniref:hypothetical protein n=1 Tax=Spirulina sp. CS-785/01 TaxID=3021716 RepID=UPI00232E4B56|nr:hypothetical protein [Spirulina sp. CS-785/01]MDB9313336.1 hypothetical protein [Spirulina sp. CS-785/01]